jgi:hypothetical protein
MGQASELAEVAQMKTDREVSALRDLTAKEFREHTKRANDPGRRYIVNFTREKIFGGGDGHHSPIGGISGGRGRGFHPGRE